MAIERIDAADSAKSAGELVDYLGRRLQGSGQSLSPSQIATAFYALAKKMATQHSVNDLSAQALVFTEEYIRSIEDSSALLGEIIDLLQGGTVGEVTKDNRDQAQNLIGQEKPKPR